MKEADRPIVAELERLDPGKRALLELRYARGVSDAELAELLGGSAEGVAARHDEALGELSGALGIPSDEVDAELRDLLAQADEPDQPAPGGRRSRGPLYALIGALLIAAAVVLVLGLSGEDDEPARSSTATPATETTPAAAETTADPAEAEVRSFFSVPLVPVEGGPDGSGTVSVREDALAVEVSGLPAPIATGGYQVWAYNSPEDAVRLGGIQRSGSFTIEEPLPPDAARYDFVDVSRERGATGSHGDASFLRAELAGRLP